MSTKVDLKVVLLGKEHTGKSCLVERYLHDRFSHETRSTVGAAFGAKKLSVGGGRSLTLGIWDTAGSERYEAMSRIYYRGAKAAIICYDICDAVSFERLRFWVNELKSNEPACAIYLCGCKLDLVESKQGVDIHEANDYADEIKAQHMQTSSKTGQGIGELFEKIASDFAASTQYSPSSRADGTGGASSASSTTIIAGSSTDAVNAGWGCC